MTKILPDKINPNLDALSGVSPSSKSAKNRSGTSAIPSDFSRILSAELDSITSGLSGEPSGSEGLPELEATFAARISQVSQLETVIPDSAGQATAILDRLDTYARNLADPEWSLRQAHDLIEEIDGDIQKLLTDTREGSDTQLKGIIDHMASLVAVEKIKLDRGDYL